MALYGITYRCGHEDTVQIYGTNVHGEREKKAAWYGSIGCPACRAAKASEEQIAAADRIIAWLKGQTSASWWIDHQYAIDAVNAAQQALAKQEA